MPTVARGGVVAIAPKIRACCLTGQGPGGVKIAATSSTGKTGTTGRPFVCGGSPAATSAASPSGCAVTTCERHFCRGRGRDLRES